jgi:hypothetical protein
MGGAGSDSTRLDQSADAIVEKDLGMLFLRGACPDCQGPLEREGGCSVCRNCGYSDCY